MIASVEDHQQSTIKIYPNPTTGIATVTLPNNETFEVFTAQGAELQNVKISETQVDLLEYSSGIYFIKSNFGTFRIIKQ